jgi:hypothetical protein
MDLQDQFLDHQLLKVHLEHLENLKLHKFDNNIDKSNPKINEQIYYERISSEYFITFALNEIASGSTE